MFFEALNYETIEQKKAYEVAGLLGIVNYLAITYLSSSPLALALALALALHLLSLSLSKIQIKIHFIK